MADAGIPAPGQLGRYRILGELGRGGMGTVYLAEDPQLGRRVALKVLPADCVQDADALARFQREARALARLSHPGIVQAYDSGQDGDRHFLVMEYVEGGSLLQLLHAAGKLAPAVATDYVCQAARALQHAHESGLVHRDLKPSNLLVTPQRKIKVLDLGLARFLQDQIGDASQTREGVVMGTPDYAAPEQLRDAHVADMRSDIYSLGCTLYHLLTGRVPFPGSSLSQKRQAHEQQQPTALEELNREIPAGLAGVVQRMMAKRPADRFQTAREVAEALAPFVATPAPLSAQSLPTSTWPGSPKPLPPRRRYAAAIRWVAGAAAAVALVLAGALLAHLLPQGTSSPNTDNDRSPTVPGDPRVLTVARDGSARFRTIADALTAAQPGMVIRVLDESVYPEPLVIDREAQEGIRLQAPNRATIQLAADCRRALAIRGVPGVHVEGFRFRDAGSPEDSCFIAVSGDCPGVVLKDLDLQSERSITGIQLEGVQAPGYQNPIVVDRCTIRVGGDGGISLASGSGGAGRERVAGGVAIRNNRVRGSRTGISISGAVARTHITGNVVWNCQYTALEVEDCAPEANGILFANNTAFDSLCDFRIWDHAPFKVYRQGQVELRNNLFFDATRADLFFVLDPGQGAASRKIGDGPKLLTVWRFDHNWRDLSGAMAGEAIPMAPGDHRLSRMALVSRDPAHPDFVRPVSTSPLASGGAGKDDPSLPGYVGALPPKGVDPWDWDRTWRLRNRSAGSQ